MKLSIVVPAYNEEKRIGDTLRKIINYADKKLPDYEILVVNDGSKDKTVDVVKRYADSRTRILQNPGNKGKGYSVKHGMMEAKGDFILFSDSDLATPIEEVEKLINFIDRYDVSFGSRQLRKKQPILRKFIGRVFTLIVNILAVPGVKDTQCGFKLFRKECAKKIFSMMTMERFSFDVEILFLARKYGYKMKEVPVIWVNKEGSKVHAIKDSYRMLRDIFKVRWNEVMGRY
jgi:dolichyl-phosphate beta-glucosyltransferase